MPGRWCGTCGGDEAMASWQALVYGDYVRDAVCRERYEVSRCAEWERRNSNLSLADVESALLGGEIVESYPGEPRGPTHLIAGYALDGRPVHVVARLLPAGRLRVIAVYAPSAERWESDWETRKGNVWAANHHGFADCSFCGGRVREMPVAVDYRTGDKLVIVEDVPAGVCEQCGEQYFTASVAKALEGLAQSEEAIQRTAVTPVRVFRVGASEV